MSTSMTHDDVRARLSALMDGVLDAREAEEVEGHLAACATCTARLVELQSMVAILRDVEAPSAPDGFAASVRSRLEHVGTRRTAMGPRIFGRLPRVQRSWRTVAAVAAVAAAGVFVLNVNRDQPPRVALQAVQNPNQLRPEAEAEIRRKMGLPPAPAPAAQAPPPAEERSAAPPAPVASGPAGAQTQQQYLVRTGKVAVEVEVFDAAARRMEAIADAVGGIVATSSLAEEGSEPRGTFVIRVPASRFADATRQIESVGRVRTREYRTQDVGEEYVDIDSRLRNLHRQEARLLSFMKRASQIPDLVAIETEVSRVRGEIEHFTGRQRYLANRINLATIEVEVTQRPKKRPGGFWDVDRTITRLKESFLSTVRQVLEAVEGVAAMVAALAPLAILAGLGWMILRRRAARRFDSM